MLYPDIEKIKIQNYACRGCPNCSFLKEIDLRTRPGVFAYLIQKRSCYLTRLTTKISILQEKVKVVEKEIREYKEALAKEEKKSSADAASQVELEKESKI